MYQIRVDDYILYDPRDPELILLNPKCKLEVNTVGEGSFTILKSHPYYDKLKPLKPVIEIRQDGEPIFRGRMTNDSRDFHNRLKVDLEGVLAYTNDSIIPPFNFPDDFPNASTADNVVAYFLEWALGLHNGQVEEWQQLKVGTVTVADPNNYISRSSEKHSSTWDVLKSKLFDSALGGYLVIRYEDDGNYVDYVKEFELTNTQQITFGENLLDITNETDASETYSAILPIGAELEDEYGEKYTLMLDSLADGDLTDDLVKKGDFIYSKSAVEQYGWICVPVSESTWSDVTLVENLKTKAMETLTGKAATLSNTMTFKAVDLHFTDSQIQSFRIYRNVLANSPAHGVTNVIYPLTKLEIDILNPQNTHITIGDTIRSLVSISGQHQSTAIQRVEQVAQMTAGVQKGVSETVQQQMQVQETAMIATCSEMILAALEQYVETGEYTEFKETVQAQLEILASEITMNFTTTTETISNVDGDIQAKFNELYKYIRFSGGGIQIGADENSLKLSLDNDMIQFTKNGLAVGWWDGTDFHTGNIVVKVNERAQFGNFAFVPRSNGSLSFLKVGG